VVLPFVSAALAASSPPIAVATATGPIVVDGVLDEPSWAFAVPEDVFLRYIPSAGGPSPGTTQVRFVQDDRALYVGIRITGSEMPIRARVSQREAINSDDQVGVYLDTFHDRRSGYIFYLNPLGIQQDIRHNSGKWNPFWDTVLRSAGNVDADKHGYTIELAIPWRSIKYESGDGPKTWGVILTRKIPGEGAKYAFPVIQRDHPIPFSEGADLIGVQPRGRGSALELQPSLTLAQSWEEGDDLDDLDLDPWYQAVRPSLDLRYGITPDLGIAATLNPDFSQVEADVADVRLNPRFAFQFPELRPFFLDGVDAYQDRSSTLYTRSIAEPLYGAKVTGREGSVSVGIVHALDQSPLASFHEDGTDGFDEEDVAGRLASTTVARGRADAFGTGYVGWTLADKRIVGGPGQSGSAGVYDAASVDTNVPLGGRWLAGGSTQHSLTSDGTAEAAWGSSSEVSVERSGGVGTGFLLAGEYTTVDFRQEAGFLTQSGLWRSKVDLDHTFTPGGGVDTVVPWLFAETTEELDGDHYRSAEVGTEVTIHGVHVPWFEAGIDHRVLDDATVPGWFAFTGYEGQIGSILEVAPKVGVLRGMDFDTLTPAADQFGELTATLRARSTRVDLTASGARHTSEGQQTELASLLRGRFNWQFTRPLGARIVVQHDRVDEAEGLEESLLLSALVTFLDVPGTELHAGWTEIIDLVTETTSERTIFLKASVLFRP